MNKEVKQTEEKPTDAERQGFDFFWQHLRRNERYQQAHANYVKAWTRSDMDAAAVAQLRILPSVGVPLFLDPKIEDSGEALRQVLEKQPGYFGGFLWRQVARLRARFGVAWWNRLGSEDCAWQSDTRARFHELLVSLNLAEHQFEGREPLVNDEGKTLTEEGRRLLEEQVDQAKAAMREFLEAHPWMDFVIDGSRPIEGEFGIKVSLAQQMEVMKDLRERVGLVDNHPPKIREGWEDHLKVYDAYLPYWEKNRCKFEALQRMRRKSLGFVEAFTALGLKLSAQENDFAQELDRAGVSPVGVYKRLERALRGAGANYGDASFMGWEREENRENTRRSWVAAVNPDWEIIEGNLDGASAEIEEPEMIRGCDDKKMMLAAWRSYFSIPTPCLPAEIAAVPGDQRRDWFCRARKKIEAAFPEHKPLPTR